ncbi:unnamed protein product [Lactuca virosa]|uniref:Uncharacterized protein n=1 Tax=Lactuca virosa TaxID=75947 RepID=A0AAU9MZ74_9ASTR|nr:unnamed protein product [Lactuca virosa]
MLKRFEPTNSVLVEYLKTINPDVETGKLLSKEEAGPSKKSKRSKKGAKATPEKPVQESKKSPVKIVPESTKSPKKPETTVIITPVEPVDDTVEKIPSKTGLFRRLKKRARGSRESSDGVLKSSPSNVRKPQLSHQGVIFREVPAPVSPLSKKRRAEDVDKHISKKKKRQRKLVVSKVSGLVRDSEIRLLEKIDHNDQNDELR